MSYPSIWFQWNGMREKKTQQNKASKWKEMKKVEEQKSKKREINLSLEAQLVVFFTMDESKEKEVRKAMKRVNWGH